jgi:type I site-specific restriction-modification system R (restriction) subunit
MTNQKKEITPEAETLQTSESTVADTFVQELAAAKGKLEEMSRAILDKAAEIENLHEVTLDQEKKFEAEVSSLKSQLEEVSKNLEAASKERDEAVNELNNIKEEALLTKRISQLKELRLLCASEESQVKQAEKIKAMSDVQFEEYTSELLEIIKSSQPEASASEAQPAGTTESEVESEVEEKALENAPESAKERIRQMLDGLKTKDEESNSNESSVLDDKEPADKECASVEKKPSVSNLTEGFLNIMKYNN